MRKSLYQWASITGIHPSVIHKHVASAKTGGDFVGKYAAEDILTVARANIENLEIRKQPHYKLAVKSNQRIIDAVTEVLNDDNNREC